MLSFFQSIESFTSGEKTHSITEWDLYALYGKDGNSLVRFMYDVEGNGQKCLVCNVGRSQDFVALRQDGTQVWRQQISDTDRSVSRHPQINNGILYYGDEVNVIAITLSTGAVLFNKAYPSNKLNLSNQGLVVISLDGTTVDILDYSTGNSIGGNFPYTLTYPSDYVQSLACADIDNDGNDEIFTCDQLGHIEAVNHDGTSLFNITSGQNHIDRFFVHDFGNGTKELCCAITPGGGNTDEGDQIALFSPAGVQNNIIDIGEPGIQLMVYDWPNGGKIAYTIEGSLSMGMLDGSLTPIWQQTAIAPQQGDQASLYDVTGNGIPDIITSTHPAVAPFENIGFRVYDLNGNNIEFNPNDSSIVIGNGWVALKSIPDLPMGYSYVIPDLILPLLRNQSTGEEKFFLNRWI